MKIAFLINDFETLKATQTTAMMLFESYDLFEDVYVLSVRDFSISTHGEICGFVSRLTSSENSEENIQILGHSPREKVYLETLQGLWIRTNPARDIQNHSLHLTALKSCKSLQKKGMVVVNDPQALIEMADKYFLMELPEKYRPKTIVTRKKKDILDFLKEQNDKIVVKPVQGTRGNGVFFVSPSFPVNINQIIETVANDGYLMVQEFLPEAIHGDMRLLVFEGELLEMDGDIAAIQRQPATGELRSNLHAGGKALQPDISETQKQYAKEMAQWLFQRGISLAGLDFIGEKVVEINVFSTGGLRDSERFTGRNFSGKLVSFFHQKLKKQFSL